LFGKSTINTFLEHIVAFLMLEFRKSPATNFDNTTVMNREERLY
jgi:hypothetical protein